MTDPTPINHPGLEPQSPAAKVLDAFLNNYTCRPSGNVAFEADRNGLAAALRAAVDQAAPELPHSELDDPEILKGIWGERRACRAELLAIATELENHQ